MADGSGTITLERDVGAAAREGEAGTRRPAKTAARAPSRRRWLRPLLFALVPLALVVGAWLYVTGGAVVSTDDAYVEADKVGVSTDVSGIVAEVDVRENQKVAAGDVLFRLDDAPFRYALQRAEAQLGIVRNDIDALKASWRQSAAAIEAAQTDVDFYTRDFNRQKELLAHGNAAQATFDAARRNLDGATQRLAQAKDQQAQIVANLAGDPNIPVEQHPRYKDALAQRDEAARQLAHTVVAAPISGVVTNVPQLQKGQYLQAATVAFNLVATDHVWIEANPKETELTNVRPGQKATVTVDTYPGREWHGTVESVAPAAASEFSLLPAQNTSGNWVKVVQRIPMRVRIDTSDGNKGDGGAATNDVPPLRAGMSVVLDVDTGHPRGIPHFIAALWGGKGGA